MKESTFMICVISTFLSMMPLEISTAFLFGPSLSIRTATSSRILLSEDPFDAFEEGGTEADGDLTPGKKEIIDEDARMNIVRSLQASFYASEETHCKRELDTSTGIVSNLPLWRVGWVELPGRSNVLNVHEGQYTHMFETILRGPEPWYFGHLHLEGGSKYLGSTPMQRYDDNMSSSTNDNDNGQWRSAKMGCLMQIRDYRRLKDGRLILLVHALERFVVDKVIQSLPYSIADAQILADYDDECCNDLNNLKNNVDENFANVQRAALVKESFSYHPYEYDKALLPLPESKYLSNPVFGSEFMSILPFCSYAATKEGLPSCESRSREESSKDNNAGQEDPEPIQLAFSGGSPPLESQLMKRGILKAVKDATKSADASETLIWLALEEYSRTKGFELPEQVLALKPPEMSYLDLPEAHNPLSSKYPKERRQRRFSYVAAGFLNRELWQGWLQVRSTKERLESVLQEFQTLQDRIYGEFL